MKNFLFISFFLLLSVLNNAQEITVLTDFAGRQKVAIVDITVAWNSTGVNISVGDTIIVFVDGIAATNTSTYEILWIGPEGMGGPDWIGGSDVPVPGASSHSIVGKIGDTGQPFYVGRRCSFVANITGELKLGINDWGLNDNYGYYVAFINSSGFPVGMRGFMGNTNINDFELSQNYPNPFNPTTTINYSVPGYSNVTVKIFDINGQLIKNLISEFQNSGAYSITWDGRNNAGMTVTSGTYFYQVQIGNLVHTKKMVLLK